MGLKEAKRQRTAQGQQTYDRHKPISKKRQRDSSPADFAFIFTKLGLPGVAEIDAFQDALIREYRYGSIAAPDFPAAIFDPALTDLTKLPLGLLDEKEAALPPDLTPDREIDLVRLCRRLIIRNEDVDVIAIVAAGLPGFSGNSSILSRHANDLLRLREQRPAVYSAIVAGQHRGALIRLRDGGMPKGFTRDGIERLLIVQGLLWCANDLQMNLARAALAERNPFDRLIDSRLRQLQPERAANDLRPRLVWMRWLLDRYVTEPEEGGPGGRVPLSKMPNDPILLMYQHKIKEHARKHGVDLLGLRQALDELIPVLRTRAGQDDDPFWEILDAPSERADLPKHFTGIWFSGLSTVESAAVTMLRYLQAEHEMVDLVRARMAMVLDGEGPPDCLAMRPFSRDHLPKGWKARAKRILYLYRRELLRDKDLPPDSPSKNAGMAVITKAATWLEKQPQRAIDDHDETAGRDRRTLYLLDVIPEARLAR